MSVKVSAAGPSHELQFNEACTMLDSAQFARLQRIYRIQMIQIQDPEIRRQVLSVQEISSLSIESLEKALQSVREISAEKFKEKIQAKPPEEEAGAEVKVADIAFTVLPEKKD